MNATSCAVGALLSLGLLASGPAVAADVFSDRLCPRASAPVTSYATLSKNENSSVDSVIVAAREAIAAYELCGKEDLAGGASEGLHYTQVRQAQFYVAIGRLQRLTNLRDDARKSLQTAIDLTQKIRSIGHRRRKLSFGQTMPGLARARHTPARFCPRRITMVRSLSATLRKSRSIDWRTRLRPRSRRPRRRAR